MSSSNVFQQKRSLLAGGSEITAEGLKTDVHQEHEISHTADGGLSATSIVWNISRDRWNRIKTGDPFRIGLGYLEGPFSTVFFGSVEQKRPPVKDGSDIKYELTGPDESEARLKAKETRWSHTWDDPTIGEVASGIAAHAGLAVGTISPPGGTLGERWPISRENSLAFWLDRLVREANDMGQKQYEWYARAGKLYFVPKEAGSGQAVTLTDGERGNTIKCDQAVGQTKKSSGGPNLEFEAFLDPRIEKDGLVSVDTETQSGVYRVGEYSLESSTDTGNHVMTGTLVPTDSQYVVNPTVSPIARRHLTQG